MPPIPTSPGVYIQETPGSLHTITGVATAIAAFLGQASMGPLDTPVACLSESDYLRVFGSPVVGSDLSQSVQQFFTNGGTQCFVVRLADGASAAQVMLTNGAGLSVLQLSAVSAGVWGLGLSVTVDYNTPSPDSTFNLKVQRVSNAGIVQAETFANLSMDPGAPQYGPAFVTRVSTLITAKPATTTTGIAAGYSEARGMPVSAGGWNTALAGMWLTPDQAGFEISVDNGPWVLVNLSKANLAAVTSDAETFTYMQSAINAALGSASGTSVEVDATPGGFLRITSSGTSKSNVQARCAAGNDLAKVLMLGVAQGGIEVSRFADLRPVPTGICLNPAGTGEILTAMDELAAADGGDVWQLTINGLTQPVSWPAGAIWQGSAGPADHDGVREKLQMLATVINSNYPGFHASVAGYRLFVQNTTPATPTSADTFSLTTTGGAAGFGDGFMANVASYPFGASTAGTYYLPLAPAPSDGNPPTQANYLGTESDRTGFHALDSVDLFNLLVIPGDGISTETEWQAIRSAAAAYCAARRAFLILDAPAAWTSNGHPTVTSSDVQAFRSAIGGPALAVNAAVYYPRVQINDAGILRYTGAAGTIAGVYAATDSARGVWKAPAGTGAALAGVTNLEATLNDQQNSLLNPLAVNCLRHFPAGYLVWGARTLEGYDSSSDSDAMYIPVRRLTLFLEESLRRGMQWVVFEPNAEPLWAQIRLSIGAFLMELFQEGAFVGGKPTDAFFVKCDSDTTTQADINSGVVNIVVGFAPLKPAEFVVISLQQIAQPPC